MRLFDISDVLSVTTGRLVSSRHIDGVYDILNFLTGDDLFTHQLPRASRECDPWLRTQFPQLFEDHPKMAEAIARLDREIDGVSKDKIGEVVNKWCLRVAVDFGLPLSLPVYEMGADMHTHIDPIEEADAMMGGRVIAIQIDKASE